MALQLLQQNSVASNANQPTTITPTLGQASTVGNLLVLVVAVSSSALPSIATPANWTNDQNIAIGVASLAIFHYFNNPGGITSVPVTLTNTNGGACACLMEFSGSGTAPAVDFSGSQNGVSNNPLSFPYPVPTTKIGELSIYALCSLPATQTVNTTFEWSQVGTQLNSTNAVSNNCALSTFYAINNGPSTPEITGSALSATVRWINNGVRYFTAGGGGITNDNISGNAGILVGQYYQGNIGG